MSYGEIKIDTITFTAGGVDTSIAVSGLVQNPTFTGNITTTGTISGDIIRGNTISGVTVTGGTGEFAGAITASGFIPNGTGVLTNGLYSPETNRVALSTNSANRFTVTESGVFLFATGVVATGVTDKGGTVQITPKTQLAGQGSNRDTVFSLLHYSSAGFHPKIILGSSNSDTFGEYTDTVSGRVYGAILFETANANNDRFGEAAAIQAVADYTPGSGLNGVPGALSFQTGPAGVVSPSERIRIASSGNVGIGSFTSGPSPSALLELRGSAAVVGTPEIFISNFGNVASGNTSSTITFRGGSLGSETSIARFTVLADGDDENGGHLAFETTASGGSLTERMRITGSGLVGIGTSSPATALHVSGSGTQRIRITGTGTANAILTLDAPSGYVNYIEYGASAATPLAFYDVANTAERARIDSSGRLLVGTSTAISVTNAVGSATSSFLEVVGGSSTDNCSATIGCFSSVSGRKPELVFAKSANNTINQHTIVASGTDLGTVSFSGSDGTNFVPAASILCEVDGTPGANDMPGRLVFSTTADGASSPTEQMRITNEGYVGIGTTNPTVPLFLAKDSTTSFIGTAVAVAALGNAASNRGMGITYDVTGNTAGLYSFGSSSNLVFYTPTGATYGERMRISNNGTITFNFTGANYEAVIFSHTATYGNGTMQIQPETAPGSGTAQFYTHFADKVSGGTTKHNVVIGGSLSKGSGSFRIPHPLKPETHELVHSFIEGPQADLIYRGHIQLVNGTATVNIDEAARMTEGTFEALCTNVCCFTSNESDWTAVRGSVSGNILTIEAQDPTSTAEVCWMVIGERKDPHMIETDWTDENGRVVTEPLKAQ